MRHHVGSTRSGGPGSGEAGFSLIEVLVAVTILGIAFTALLGAMATSIHTSDLHRQQAEVQAVLGSAVERVKSPETDRVPCATPTDATYQKAAREAVIAQRWATTSAEAATWVKIRQIRYADGNYADGNDGFGDTCFDSGGATCMSGAASVPCAVPVTGPGVPLDTTYMLTLQEITIQVIHPDGRQDRSLTFIKGVG